MKKLTALVIAVFAALTFAAVAQESAEKVKQLATEQKELQLKLRNAESALLKSNEAVKQQIVDLEKQMTELRLKREEAFNTASPEVAGMRKRIAEIGEEMKAIRNEEMKQKREAAEAAKKAAAAKKAEKPAAAAE